MDKMTLLAPTNFLFLNYFILYKHSLHILPAPTPSPTPTLSKFIFSWWLMFFIDLQRPNYMVQCCKIIPIWHDEHCYKPSGEVGVLWLNSQNFENHNCVDICQGKLSWNIQYVTEWYNRKIRMTAFSVQSIYKFKTPLTIYSLQIYKHI